MICRNDHCYASRAQKPHFRVKTTKNLRKIAHSDTKLSILCSKGLKMGVPKSKSAQKPRFCARRASQNSTEQLGGARNQYGEARRGREQPPETGQDRLERSATSRSTTQRNRHATARSTTKRNRNATQHNATHATQRNTRNATQAPRNCTMGNNKKGDNLSGCLL